MCVCEVVKVVVTEQNRPARTATLTSIRRMLYSISGLFIAILCRMEGLDAGGVFGWQQEHW